MACRASRRHDAFRSDTFVIAPTTLAPRQRLKIHKRRVFRQQEAGHSRGLYTLEPVGMAAMSGAAPCMGRASEPFTHPHLQGSLLQPSRRAAVSLDVGPGPGTLFVAGVVVVQRGEDGFNDLTDLIAASGARLGHGCDGQGPDLVEDVLVRAAGEQRGYRDADRADADGHLGACPHRHRATIARDHPRPDRARPCQRDPIPAR